MRYGWKRGSQAISRPTRPCACRFRIEPGIDPLDGHHERPMQLNWLLRDGAVDKRDLAVRLVKRQPGVGLAASTWTASQYVALPRSRFTSPPLPLSATIHQLHAGALFQLLQGIDASDIDFCRASKVRGSNSSRVALIGVNRSLMSSRRQKRQDVRPELEQFPFGGDTLGVGAVIELVDQRFDLGLDIVWLVGRRGSTLPGQPKTSKHRFFMTATFHYSLNCPQPVFPHVADRNRPLPRRSRDIRRDHPEPPAGPASAWPGTAPATDRRESPELSVILLHAGLPGQHACLFVGVGMAGQRQQHVKRLGRHRVLAVFQHLPHAGHVRLDRRPCCRSADGCRRQTPPRTP